MGLFSDPVFRKREAWGYIWILLIRGTSWTTWVFLAVAILKYANNSVGCTSRGFEIMMNSTMDRSQTEDEANAAEVECTGEIPFLGRLLTPSTSIPFVASIGSIACLLITPVFGVLIDRTTKRKLWTFGTLGAYVGTSALQIWSNADNWLLMLVMQVSWKGRSKNK